ncbi:MAG TPA: hypothetical protein VHJ76_02665 [Actinomycetota bacterium]|nr:hypothetical protein [Actinomycetota bacterium]
MKVVRIPMSTARATAAGMAAALAAAILWAVQDGVHPGGVAVGAAFAGLLTHNRWKYDPGDAYQWGWANAALGMAGGGVMTSWLADGGGLGVGLALGSAFALVAFPRLKRPREKAR